MANWKFTEQYATKYPSLKSTVLGLIAFSDHHLDGESFTGTIDIKGSGPALTVLGLLTKSDSITVAGKIIENGSSLNISLISSDKQGITSAVKSALPAPVDDVLEKATIEIKVVAESSTGDSSLAKANSLSLEVVLAVGSHKLDLTATVPMATSGTMQVSGEFENVGVSLKELGFLMGDLSSSDNWFPSKELGPLFNSGASLNLLGMSLLLFVKASPFEVSFSGVTVSIGINDIPILDDKLYLNPLAVWATVTNPTSKAAVTWGIEGAILLCNFDHPGDLTKADFEFDFSMGLSDFSISGIFPNASNKPVNLLLQDMIGHSADIGLSDSLTINKFDFSASADKTSGKIGEFSTDLEMSGGFGLLEDLDLESMSIGISYTGS